MQAAIYILASIGLLWLLWFVVWPICWYLLYATMHTVFLCRVAIAGRRMTAWQIAQAAPGHWLHTLKRAFFYWTPDEISCDRFRWKPLFKFYGFKEPTALEPPLPVAVLTRLMAARAWRDAASRRVSSPRLARRRARLLMVRLPPSRAYVVRRIRTASGCHSGRRRTQAGCRPRW